MKIKEIMIGAAAGFVNGLLGAGGGTILVPALQRFLNIEAHKSHATAIAIIFPLSVISALVYARSGNIDWPAILYVSAGGVAGGVIGAKLLNKITKTSLRKFFSVFMVIAALRMIFSGAEGTAGEGLLNAAIKFAPLYAAVGLAAGIISGLGIGGGTLLIPALVILFGIPQRDAQNINLIYFIPTAAVALVVHIKNGNVRAKGLPVMITAGLAAAAGAAFLATKTDADLLRKIFGAFLLVMGVLEFKRAR
ncbi:MAG: sulfite exporter TauE/SafE family protein [Clostridiales bacterium]|jgi:uncharacterized membrane protein YfcA|nr:sulfite exporter TauE/SafE family protein [Clostridiales bacterium]